MSDEEQNLSRRERRAQGKSGKSGDSGSEEIKDRNQRLRAEAAAKRRKLREEERSSAAQEGLATGERVDDALSRSADAGVRFLRANFVWLQWIVIAGLAAGMGFLIYEYREDVAAEKAGTKLAGILSTEFGRIASTDAVTPSDRRLVDPRPEFESEQVRAQKAAEKWNSLKGAKAGALKLSAMLGRAGALYDQGKFVEARAAYESILADGQSKLLPQIKGRALEGVGFTLESEKKYEEAKTAFEKLSSVESKEFSGLQKFHVARIEFLLGNRDKAKELLSALDTKLSEGAGPQGPTDYLGAAVRDLLKTVDPTKAQEEQQALSAEQMQEFLKQFEAMQKNNGTPGEPPGMPAPMELPESSEEGDLPPSEATAPAENNQAAPPASPQAPPAPAAAAPAQPPTPKAPVAAPTPKPPTPPRSAPEPAPAPPQPAPSAPTPTTPPTAPAPSPGTP